jgi:hypothetical protein
MRGPYRTLTVPPERHETYWKSLERHEQQRRRLRWAFAGVAAFPALTVITSVGIDEALARPEAPILEKALEQPWGLVISEHAVDPLLHARPQGAPFPDRAATPIPAAELQRLLTAHSPNFQRCFAAEARFLPQLSGDLIVSIALREGHVESVVTGKKLLRGWLGPCVRREVGRIEFPSTHGEVAWIHFPLRFVSRQPPSQGAGNTSI